MLTSICGADCAQCPSRDACGGCRESGGRPFGCGGECPLAACCREKGQEHCGSCGGTCGLKSRLLAECNALDIPDLPEVTDLNVLPGFYINLPYTLSNGQTVRLLEDGKVYLGCQLEPRGGSRCYGLAASESHILVCEYGEGGSNGEIVLYKRRTARA